MRIGDGYNIKNPFIMKKRSDYSKNMAFAMKKRGGYYENMGWLL